MTEKATAKPAAEKKPAKTPTKTAAQKKAEANMAIWNVLKTTDPERTKPFTRPGGFSGTAVDAMYVFEKLTRSFGAAGQGWGMHEPIFTEKAGVDGEVLVYCKVRVWIADPENAVYGMGGDKVVSKTKNGLRSDDEAYKKAYTDALTNGFKLFGMSADVYSGLYDDSKYVDQLRGIAEKRKSPPAEDWGSDKVVADAEGPAVPEKSREDWKPREELPSSGYHAMAEGAEEHEKAAQDDPSSRVDDFYTTDEGTFDPETGEVRPAEEMGVTPDDWDAPSGDEDYWGERRDFIAKELSACETADQMKAVWKSRACQDILKKAAAPIPETLIQHKDNCLKSLAGRGRR